MKLLILLLLACLIGIAQSGAVVGIDFGSQFMKMAVIKHGVGVDVVLNEQTQRKTITYIGFRGEERYFGEDANGLHTRFPVSMVTYLAHWVGVTYDEAMKDQEGLLFRYKFIRTERDTVAVEVAPGVQYSAEELLAMYLAYARKMATTHAETPVNDAVIAVPASYNLRQRQAIKDAASLAGLRVLNLMPGSFAAVLQFGIGKLGFGKETYNTVVFDMGASKLEVGVYTFLPPTNTSTKAESLGRLQVRGFAWDQTNGGRHYDALIAKYVAAEFMEKGGPDVLSMTTNEGAKAVAKLMRSAQKAKEMLSANKFCPVPVEGLYDERDFNTKLTREKFEEMAEPLVARAMATVEQALLNAGLTKDDVSSVELMGGGTRIPIVQTKLQEMFAGKPLGKTLNTDEAIATGTAFQAARVHPDFRVRAFAVQDNSPFNFTFALSPTEEVPSPAQRPLFIESQMPASKIITTYRAFNYNLTVYAQTIGENGEVISEPIDIYSLKKVNSSLHSLGKYKEDAHNESTHYVETKMHLDSSGLVSCTNAYVKYNEVKNATKKVKRKTSQANATNATEEGDAKAEEGAQDEETEEPKAEEAAPEQEAKKEGEANEGEAQEAEAKEGEAKEGEAKEGEAQEGEADKKEEAEEKKEPEYDIVNTTTTKKHQSALKVQVQNVLRPFPMTDEEKKNATARMTELDMRDAEKRRIAEAKNNLETLLYNTKYDKFFDVEELKEFYNETEEEAIRAALASVDEWLEEDGYDATADAYLNKTATINNLINPVYKKQEKKRKADLKKEKKEKEKAKKEEKKEESKAEEKDTKQGEENADKKDEL